MSRDSKTGKIICSTNKARLKNGSSHPILAWYIGWIPETEDSISIKEIKALGSA